jgi:2-polyprenyl-3-methyl-5-hydroxy-6-metoxy-1,4-benzoquinol methylase
MNSTFNPIEEKVFLNSLVSDYNDVSPYSRIKKDIIIGYINEFIKNQEEKRALQMGCSNGYETEQLSKKFNQLDVVDGSSVFVNKLKQENKNKNINFICALFEEFTVEDTKKYDFIFCNYVLEHVYDSFAVLKQILKLLKPEGLLFVVVPNFQALSRRMALAMGLLHDLEELTQNDKAHGHRRVYNLSRISSELESSGFKIFDTKGIIFKTFADFQLNKLLKDEFITRKHINALQQLANEPGNINFSDSFFLVSKIAKS